MSWIQKLYQTYNNCQDAIGVETPGNGVPLLPICHTTQMAQIEIVLDGQGNFLRGCVIPKSEARTIIPCTEKSGGRTSGEAAHPLCDKLQYIAADYIERGGTKKFYFASYVAQLEEWCSSNYSHPKARAVLKYVKKGCLTADLISSHVLVADLSGQLIIKWDKKKDGNSPPIFEVLTTQDDAFIRWQVEVPGEAETRVWRDRSLWNAWISYYRSTRQAKSICYVTGEESFTAEQHLAKLRNDGDKAKLISSNDKEGFTFRGRFISANQAATVAFEATQKAHLALRWLISRQGYTKGDLAVVAWATSGKPVPQPTDDPKDILGDEDLPEEGLPALNTAQEIAIRLNKRIAGYSKELGDTADIIIMAVDSATPGRMAITYYRELTGSDFLQRINEWHTSCAWFHIYRSKGDSLKNRKSKPVYFPFIGAPAPSDIAEAAYGRRMDDKLRSATILRILPCIIDRQPIPRDLIDSVVRRACNRMGLEAWEWNKTLSIACSLFKKYNWKEDYHMTLELDRKTRDYLYGRLLALAENLEAWALRESHEKRETNAARLMQRFAERPFSTWRTIELSLAPYKARLGGKAWKQLSMIDEVIDSFQPEDFIRDTRLSGEFLLGYHSQREYLRPWNNKDQVSETKSEDLESKDLNY